jgi:hypothetical protein
LLPTSLFLSWCFYRMNFNQKRSEQKWEGRYEVCTLVFGIRWAFCFPLISINIRLGIMRWEEGCSVMEKGASQPWGGQVKEH